MTKLLTMPAPGAAFKTTSTLPNMMYHFDVSCGASPDLEMVKETPSLPYVGSDCGVKLSDAELKSMLTVRANAESGGQSVRTVGLQLVYVCAVEGATRHAAEARAARALIVERMSSCVEVRGNDRCQLRLPRGRRSTGVAIDIAETGSDCTANYVSEGMVWYNGGMLFAVPFGVRWRVNGERCNGCDGCDALQPGNYKLTRLLLAILHAATYVLVDNQGPEAWHAISCMGGGPWTYK
jgi:hypothetical protein